MVFPSSALLGRACPITGVIITGNAGSRFKADDPRRSGGIDTFGHHSGKKENPAIGPGFHVFNGE